jgi:hypothetical protein
MAERTTPLRQSTNESIITEAIKNVDLAYDTAEIKTPLESDLMQAVKLSAKIVAANAFRKGDVLPQCHVLQSRTLSFLRQSYLDDVKAKELQATITKLESNCETISKDSKPDRTNQKVAYALEADIDKGLNAKVTENANAAFEGYDGKTTALYKAQVNWYVRCKLFLSRLTCLQIVWNEMQPFLTFQQEPLFSMFLEKPMQRIVENYITPMLASYTAQLARHEEMKYRRGYTEKLHNDMQEVVMTLQTMLANQMVLRWCVLALTPFLKVHMELAGVYTLPLWYREASTDDTPPESLSTTPYHASAVANIRNVPWQYLETMKVCKEKKSFRLNAQQNYILAPANQIVAEFSQAMREALFYLDHMIDVCERQTRGEPPLAYRTDDDDDAADEEEPRVMPAPWPAELLLLPAMTPRSFLPLAPLLFSG